MVDQGSGTAAFEAATSLPAENGKTVSGGERGQREDSVIRNVDNHADPDIQHNETYKDKPSESSTNLLSPKVRYRLEYREMKDAMLLFTRETSENKKQLDVHEGPVFDVVHVNYTSETKDTQKSKETNERGSKEAAVPTDADSSSPPSVHVRGRSFIRIYSRAIINALQSVVNYYPNHDIVAQPTEIRQPYAILVHHWDELKAFREKYNPDKINESVTDCSVNDTWEHVGLLLDFLEDEMGSKVRKEYERWKQPVPVVSFEMLWLLLKPGIDIYQHVDEDQSKEPWVVSRVYFDIFNQSWESYDLRLWYMGNDSTSIQPRWVDREVPRFHGEKPIHELKYFPVEYFPQHETRKQELVDRGKLFVSLQQKKCMYFDGESSDTPRQPYKGYVMVDPIQAFEDNPDVDENLQVIVDQKLHQLPLCSCTRCSSIDCERKRPPKFLGYKRIALTDTSKMTDHQYFLCAWSVKTFVLAVRQWKTLLLTGFREPEWNTTLMDSLVLKEDIKRMLQNLSRLYLSQQLSSPSSAAPLTPTDGRPKAKPWTADYIEDKGKGLVVLLHGKPGVGKTYTAECIAHSLQRPLLSITCADIGVDPPEVEKKLRRWFKIARLWDAILLIDEADVYFESRETQDLERNNLVASFLRAMEYYDGILFLTTNRIGTSDEAVWSRIHATIYYDDFTDEQRQRIWNTYFDKLERERGEEIRVLESAKDYVSEAQAVKDLKWNGREIRNAFQIAVNLAQAEDARDDKGRFTVRRDHIKVTVDLLKDFENYMHTLHKKSQSQRAVIHGNRFDAYGAAGNTRGDFI